jgi:hypothetical protein
MGTEGWRMISSRKEFMLRFIINPRVYCMSPNSIITEQNNK